MGVFEEARSDASNDVFLADKDVTDPTEKQQSSVSARACCAAAYLTFSLRFFLHPEPGLGYLHWPCFPTSSTFSMACHVFLILESVACGPHEVSWRRVEH